MKQDYGGAGMGGGGGDWRQSLEDSFDGLLEGHESPCYRQIYRGGMFCFVMLSIVCIILPLAAVGGDIGWMGIAHAIALAGMLFSALTLIRWYRQDGMSSKFKKLVYVVIAFTILADIVAIAMFSFTAPSGCDAVDTPSPWGTPQPGTQMCKQNVACVNNIPLCEAPFEAACTSSLPICPQTPLPGSLTPRPPPGPITAYADGVPAGLTGDHGVPQLQPSVPTPAPGPLALKDGS